MKNIFLAFATATALSGCLVAQNEAVRTLSYQQANKAIPIGSTKDRVRQVLGKPNTVNSFNGEEMWSYVDQKVDIGKIISPLTPWTKGYDTKGFIIRFNRNGRVKTVDQTTFNL